MSREGRNVILPVVLVVLGVMLLHGCIYIPTFNKVEEGRNVTKQIGDSDSRKPIRINRANRADVERILGPPSYASADRMTIAYTWRVLEGVWVMPFCFAIADQRGVRAAILSFDQSGVLRSMRVVKDSDHFLHEARAETLIPRHLQPQPSAAPPSFPHAPANNLPPPPGPTYETQPKTSP